MNPKISELLDRIRQIEEQIEHETKRRRAELQVLRADLTRLDADAKKQQSEA